MESPRPHGLWSGIPVKLLALPLICGAISSAQAGLLAYEGFGNAVNAATLTGYSGSVAESGLTGIWGTVGGATTTTTPPRYGFQIGIFNGPGVVEARPDNAADAQHVVTHSGFNTMRASRPLATAVNLDVDGTHFMSFFAAAAGSDFVAQVGLGNATNEVMAGPAYNNDTRGLNAFFGALNGSTTTGFPVVPAGAGNIGAFSFADRNLFFTAQFVKTNSGTTNDLAVTVTAYDLGNTVDVDISTLVEGTSKKTRTINLTGVIGSFTDLRFNIDGTVDMDEIRLGTTLADVTRDTDTDGDLLPDKWEIKYFGNLTRNGTLDFDSDGLIDSQEYKKYTNPTLADTDGDGLTDNQEVTGSANTAFGNTPTNPLKADTDGDGATDNQEVTGSLNTSFANAPTNPNVADTDADGFNDYKEMLYKSNPNSAGSVPAVFFYIDNTKNNGSFETKNGGTQITTKITKWDVVGDDIDNWTEWSVAVGGISTAANDSGVDGGGSNGTRLGYFQSGNAAYNMTTSVAAEGTLYNAKWKQLNQSGNTITARLVYQDGAQILPVPGALATTNTVTTGDLFFQIPVGSPAIGKPIGVALSSVGAWINVDEVSLSIGSAGDADGDGLPDVWEIANFGNITAQNASGNPDGDAYNNLQEYTGGSDPNNAASIPGDIDGDGLGDAWEMTYFGGLSDPQGAPGLDPDGDHDTNLVEFGNLTDPNDKYDFFSSTGDFGASDSWKSFYGISLATDSYNNDQDSDALDDAYEFDFGTNPVNPDTDGDGRLDGAEIFGSPTSDPFLPDTDGDTLTDGQEVNTYGTDPKLKDTDGDGYNDNVEITAGSFALDSSSTPITISGATVLIDQLHNNGSFELLGGVAGSIAKATHWDTDPDGDVDNWVIWDATASGPATALNDSGSEYIPAEASAGSRVGFLQGANAAYNRTGHIIAAGQQFTYTWDYVLAFRGVVTAQLAYWDPALNGGLGGAVVISGTESSNPDNATKYLGLGNTWTVAGGDPAIGKEIVMTIAATGNYPEVDNFVLSFGGVVNPDSDGDGMADAWEQTYFGNLAQTAAGDFDGDGTTNLTEFRLGLIPNSGNSRFTATRSAAGMITWQSVTGVTFKIERSTTLGTWSTLEAALPGTAGTANYTDPSPPVGKAFYRIGLNP